MADPTAKIALLRVAEEMFAERGAAGAKVEDIARRAGLSKGAFYLHFESKDAALKEIAETWLARCAFLLRGPTDPDARDPEAMLGFCIERDIQLYEFLRQSRTTLRVLYACQGEYGYMFETFRQEMNRRNSERLGQWHKGGLIRSDVSTELAATLMSGAHEQLSSKLIRADQRPAIHQWVEFALQTFVRAFGTPELINALEYRKELSWRRDNRASVEKHNEK